MNLMTFEEFNTENKNNIQDWKDRAQAYGDYCAREALIAAIDACNEWHKFDRTTVAKNYVLAYDQCAKAIYALLKELK